MIENTCCFTGHRPNKLYGYSPSIEGNKKLLWKLREIIIEHIEKNKVDTFITGMALGIDMWAARIVLKLKEKYPYIRLVAAIPCKNQSNKWIQESKQEWNYIIEKCDKVHFVSDEEYTAWCMQKRNEWMVDNSKYVIAVWDGSKGGTGNCIKYAEKQNKLITTLNPSIYEVIE